MSAILKATSEVFKNIYYLVLAGLVSLFFLLLLAWLPNLKLLGQFIFSSQINFLDKIWFLFGGLGILKTNFTFWSGIMALIISLLIGINTALLVYSINKKSALYSASGLGLGGFLGSILGTGCASCGSVVLSLLGLSGAAALLPFGGQEFNFLAIVLLVWSLYSVSKGIVGKTC